MPRLPVPILHRVFPVAGHRLVVIDPGTRTLKVLVVESTWGRMRILHRQTIDLEEEGPGSAISLRDQLALALPELVFERVALVLPQHRVISTLLEAPGEALEATRFIESEARKLSGLSEETMFHGHARLQPFAHWRNPRFVTLCKREEIDTFVERFVPSTDAAPESADGAELAEVVTTGQAMFAAVLAGPHPPTHAVVVDLGADNTVVGIVLNGQGVHATSFEGGSSGFTAAIAADRNCPWPVAERLKRTDDVLSPPSTSPGCAQAVENWYADFQRAVVEWMDDFPDLGIAWQTLPVYLCGGGGSQPGLVEHLNRLGSLRFQPWPAAAEVDRDLAMDQYWVAYGAARTALGQAGTAISLLPPELRMLAHRRRWWEWLQAANVLLVLLIAAVLGFATWHKKALVDQKVRLIGQARSALSSAETVVQLAGRLEAGYEGIRPLLQHQRQSLDTLAALAAIRQVRTNNDFWLVLFADAASYASAPILPLSTNQVPATPTPPPSEAPSLRREFIAELCIPQEGDAARRILSQVVADLKQHPVFARVDALPPERRRAVADPRVFITNRLFAVAMEVASNETNAVVSPAPGPARDSGKSGKSLRLRADAP